MSATFATSRGASRACRALLVLASAAASSAAAVSVSVAPGVLNVVDAAFASFNIDPSCNRGFHFTRFDNRNLIAAAAALAPARLRFGGSGADELTYGLSEGSPECAGIAPPQPPDTANCSYFTRGCLNSTQTERVFALAQGAGADLIMGASFGLIEACKAGLDFVWATDRGGGQNAASLLAGLRARGLKPWAFELGNEIDNRNLNEGALCNITAAQQAAAFDAFADMVADALPGTLLVGPDTGGRDPQQWLQALLPALGPGAQLHAVTHHVYNGVDRKSWASAAQLDSILPEIAWYTSTVRSLAPHSAIWAGENGPTGGGDDGTCGSEAVCGRYASSVWYADDMSLRAKNGFVAHQRQDLFGGMYGLTNSLSSTMALGADDPISLTADFWLSFLFKRTLGLAVHNATSSDASVRAYAYSGLPPSRFAAPQCAQAQQLLLLNLAAEAADVSLPEGVAGDFAAWTLAAAGGDVFGFAATLNGVALPVKVDAGGGEDPSAFLSNISVAPTTGPVSGGVTLAPQSSTFLCYGAAPATAPAPAPAPAPGLPAAAHSQRAAPAPSVQLAPVSPSAAPPTTLFRDVNSAFTVFGDSRVYYRLVDAASQSIEACAASAAGWSNASAPGERCESATFFKAAHNASFQGRKYAYDPYRPPNPHF